MKTPLIFAFLSAISSLSFSEVITYIPPQTLINQKLPVGSESIKKLAKVRKEYINSLSNMLGYASLVGVGDVKEVVPYLSTLPTSTKDYLADITNLHNSAMQAVEMVTPVTSIASKKQNGISVVMRDINISSAEFSCKSLPVYEIFYRGEAHLIEVSCTDHSHSKPVTLSTSLLIGYGVDFELHSLNSALAKVDPLSDKPVTTMVSDIQNLKNYDVSFILRFQGN